MQRIINKFENCRNWLIYICQLGTQFKRITVSNKSFMKIKCCRQVWWIRSCLSVLYVINVSVAGVKCLEIWKGFSCFLSLIESTWNFFSFRVTMVLKPGALEDVSSNRYLKKRFGCWTWQKNAKHFWYNWRIIPYILHSRLLCHKWYFFQIKSPISTFYLCLLVIYVISLFYLNENF